jgi:hypothetical protein
MQTSKECIWEICLQLSVFIIRNVLLFDVVFSIETDNIRPKGHCVSNIRTSTQAGFYIVIIALLLP